LFTLALTTVIPTPGAFTLAVLGYPASRLSEPFSPDHLFTCSLESPKATDLAKPVNDGHQ
jgi:hypothetical protein